MANHSGGSRESNFVENFDEHVGLPREKSVEEEAQEIFGDFESPALQRGGVDEI